MTTNTDAPVAHVIGDPITHSKSPLIHRFWLEALEMIGDYDAVHVTPADLGEYIARQRDMPEWRGCNVTLPHKLAILDHVADKGGLRDDLGAANTVFRDENGDLAATNTDIAGFYSPLAGFPFEESHVVVIGAGGAARAALYALGKAGTARVTVMNRSPLKAMGLIAKFGLKGDVVPLGSPLPPADLLVNASSLGMRGQPALDIDLSPLPDDATVYDIVYAPLETALLAQARERDLDTIDGLEMLIGQAALAFELFFGAEPPRDRDDELRAALTA
ncbi:shikimate dehydrogenase [Stakelama sp. CBK3Z-3]|uniref:Shikimate dehydrogenase (NADP(+)) n=1 Tax=Stakelama flava TaxID=2860338 RepID=A0ABS6XKJ3_9SPHN|nr:shikimate dehydrogenase [Stakelama flava]MBW4330727.1 shikimate dehydrogenase [Stakelama flava]